jgi:hypothetical protein
MKRTLRDCEANWLEEFASGAQFWSAPEARALHNLFPRLGAQMD